MTGRPLRARLATQALAVGAGPTAAGYHSVYPGIPSSARVVRRITGRSLGEFFADDVAGAAGAPTSTWGLPAEHDHRGRALHPSGPSQDEDYVAQRPRAQAAPANGTGIRVS